MGDLTWQLLFAAVFGGVVGATELGARYRDDPAAALRTLPGLLYMAVNAMAAMAALVIVEAFGWTFGLDSHASAAQIHIVQVLVAGIGSAALFRSSFFMVLLGDQEFGIGPSAILTSLFKLVDRSVDRRRALERLKRDDLSGLSFARDHVALTELCIGALQNLDKAEAHALGQLAGRLKNEPDLSDSEKLDCFSLELMTLVGPKAIQAAAQRLRDRRAAEVPESLEPAEEGPSATPMPIGQPTVIGTAGAWRKRLAELDPLVSQSDPTSRSLEATLEAAWLHQQLNEQERASALYRSLWPVVGRMTPQLTNHELLVAFTHVQMSLILEGYYEDHWMDEFPQDRLVDLCMRPGGSADCYAAALYMLAELHELTDDHAVAYITGALELLPLCQRMPYRDFASLLHAVRACCYLAQGNTRAAADDLMLVSKTTDRELQIISGTLSSVLQPDLPDDLASALWRVVRPFGFFPLAAHESLAQQLEEHIPPVVRNTPLVVVDLIRYEEIRLPECCQEPLAADAASELATAPSVHGQLSRAKGSLESLRASYSGRTHRDEVGTPDVSA